VPYEISIWFRHKCQQTVSFNDCIYVVNSPNIDIFSVLPALSFFCLGFYRKMISHGRGGRNYKGSKYPKNSSLLPLNLVLDSDGILGVGGRIQHILNNQLPREDLLPIIIQK
jgi:hypothetical protein